MSRVPLGKVLLRNVIRHTDAHNKIQEESEMWKIREMEKQSEDVQWGKKRKMLPHSSCSRMRSDGFDEEAAWKARDLTSMAVETEDDLRHARYWNKKLYEYESNMPDRWGHSGYKELYPEEFDTDSDQEREEQHSVNGKRKSQPDKLSVLELPKRKKPKKSHKKKWKKKSHKKRKKKKKREQPSAAAESSQVESESSEGNVGKRKRKHHRKARKAPARLSASSSGQESSPSKASSSGDSELEGKPERQPKKKKRRKHSSPASERGGDKVQEKRSKRKNWKVAADENSEDSSDED
ncbi:hypothetical protein JRQ81_010632 [Phrynocephalus forsythii]|uniref:NKAP domain containing 1 n=1 Tax=Phrynocephalus forsythii TaxID=171643 RepID=A0A9Q1AQL6_9SAUR|nr:hypothetical protein JRQ81_010632 [Phrynocephalus forsythii]